jgi:hypothetical protein
MSRFSRATRWLLAAGLMTVVAVAPAQASAHHVKVHHAKLRHRYHVTGEQTTITPSSAATQFLTAHGVTVTAVGAATSAGGAFTLPITGGHVVVPADRGVIIHKGGLQFSIATRKLTLRHFVLSKVGKDAVLSAFAAGRPLRLARLANPVISTDGSTTTLTGELKLTPAAAHAINRLLGAHTLAAGADLGALASTITVG